MSDENRLAVVMNLARGPASVGELVAELGLSQALVSHHLRALRETCLVSVEARGRSNVYSLCCDPVTDAIRALTDLTESARSPEPAEPAETRACCSPPESQPAPDQEDTDVETNR